MIITASKDFLAGSVLLALAVFTVTVRADQVIQPPSPEKVFKGTVVSVDPDEHLLYVKDWVHSHEVFNLGTNCVYSEALRDNVSIALLRPGERVKVYYENQNGVWIADRVEQIPLRLEGVITGLDATNHSLTLHHALFTRQLRLPDNCQVVLRDGKAGTLADIALGNAVTLIYETPDDIPTVQQIAQNSLEFAGSLTAIDLGARTVKAQTLFAAKKFNVADHCVIVVNGRPNGRLADLKPNDKLVFSYNEVNGVNIVNRIAPEEFPSVPVATTGTSVAAH